MDIKTQIRDYIAENIVYSDNGFAYDDDASFLEEGIIDSSTTLELVLFIEETYNVTVPDRDIVPNNFDSVEKLANYTSRRLKENGS